MDKDTKGISLILVCNSMRSRMAKEKSHTGCNGATGMLIGRLNGLVCMYYFMGAELIKMVLLVRPR